MARGKNEVTLTFAGDADQLERASKRAAASTEMVEKAFDEVAAAAKRSDTAMSGVDAATSRFSDFAGRGGADLRRYGSDLDGVGDGFNDVEDRAMGAGNLINGFNDIMTSKDPATYAMGLSDMAAGVRYTVVPSIQDGIKSVKGLADRMRSGGGMVEAFKRNIGGVGLAAGGITVGLTAAAMALEAFRKRQFASDVEELSRQFLAASGSAEAMSDVFEDAAGKGPVQILAAFKDVLATSPEVAQEFLDAAEAAGLSDEVLANLRQTLDETTTAERKTGEQTDTMADAWDRAEQAVSNLHDKLREGINPLFDYEDAVRGNQEAIAAEQEAQQNLADVLADPDSTMADAAQAQRDLDAAHQDVIGTAFDLAEAEDQLQTALQDGRVTGGELEGVLRVLQDRGYTSADAMIWLKQQIDNLPENKTINVVTRQSTIIAGSRNVPLADGGLAYAASGWVRRGTDTVPAMLTPGEMVLNRGQQENLFRMIDSGGRSAGGTVRLVIDSGSNPVDRMLADMLRRIIRVEHGGNVQAALGYG